MYMQVNNININRVPLQSHLRKLNVMQAFASPKIRVKQAPSVQIGHNWIYSDF